MSLISDHPKQVLLHGICSRCHGRFDWRLLEPLTTIHQKIKLLCPGCRMETKPKESVCCDGTA